jgi:WhiB family redox-sensing transcriptional regulator
MDWRHRAACRDEDPELHFPIGSSGPALLQIAEAKTVCRRCPSVSPCLSYALETGQDFGVWGGLSEDERRALKRRNARTRAKATIVEETAPEPEPVLVDGIPMAAPATTADRLYQDRRPPIGQRLHAVMDNGRTPCGSRLVLDMEHQRPVTELAEWRRCRTVACRRVFALADEAVARG